jgi:hypothetical protein
MFVEKTIVGNFSNAVPISLLEGQAAKRIAVRFASFHNRDTAPVTVTFSFERQSVSFPITKVTLQPGETFVFDSLLVLEGTSDKLIGVLAATVTSFQPAFVITYAEVT